jgi:RNA polymerase sigma factor (sigma-70 family)
LNSASVSGVGASGVFAARTSSIAFSRCSCVVIIAARVASPACEPLSAADEFTAATRIAEQRASLWAALAGFAAALRCRKSSASVAWAANNDSDDEALLALTACALTLAASRDDLRSMGSTIRGVAASLKRCKDRLAERNLRLVVSCAMRQGRATGYLLPIADLIQEGSIGLMKAVCRFDPARGFRFSTMARWWIDHHMGRAIADSARCIRLPVHVTEGKSKVAKAIISLAAAGIADPTDAMISRECTRRTLTAIAEKAGTPPPTEEQITRGMVASRRGQNAMTVKRVKAIRIAMGIATISGSTPMTGDRDEPDERPILDAMPSHTAPPPDINAEERERDAILATVLGELPASTAGILRRRHGIGMDEPMTLEQIASDETLGLAVSRERIRQLHARGIVQAQAVVARLGVRASDVTWTEGLSWA